MVDHQLVTPLDQTAATNAPVQANIPDWAASDVVLADGSTARLRPITARDADALVRFHETLSADSIYMRFFSAHPHLSDREVTSFTRVDGTERMALVATRRDEIIGVARYDRLPEAPNQAEVAFVVGDAYQRRGIGTLLLEHLAAYARTRGIDVFVAETLSENGQMRDLFHRAGFAEVSRYDRGVVQVRMDINPSAEAVQTIESRSAAAAAQSIAGVLRPRSVAVIGAGRSRGGIGHEILRNILQGGFQGPVYPVHPTARSVASVRAYPNVVDISDEIDLAVVAVPHDQVEGVLADCTAKGIRAAVVVSAGFAETGPAGAEKQQQIVDQVRRGGIRLVGPNCLGVINTAPDVSLNATFAPIPPEPGNVAFSSQSGGLGIAVLEDARRRRVGLSSFVSVGNKCDISGNDLLQYWRQDPATDVILLYLESFGNPRRFARIAKEVSRNKPIVAVKAGRSPAGTRAASSHTAALATPDVAVDALFRQTGVIRVDTLAEMFDTAQILSSQPLPAGRRVAILGNAGGPGILAADACAAAGLEVPELSTETQRQLRSFLRPEAASHNPVDLVSSASATDYERALRILLVDEAVDAVLTIFVPPLVTSASEVAASISRAAEGSQKTIISNFLGMEEPPVELVSDSRVVPSFSFPEPAVWALARVCAYAEWRAKPEGHEAPRDETRAATGRQIIRSVLARNPSGAWMAPEGVERLLSAYGIATPRSEVVTSAGEAARTATEIGFPVAVKAVGPTLVHKSDIGGVSLNLGSSAEVRSAYSEMKRRLGKPMTGALVQEMIDSAVETVIGVTHDSSFGPLIMFGSGGTAVELFKDQSFRSLPLTDVDAAELVRSTRGSPLLFGFRGAPPANADALEQMLIQVASMAEDLPELAEMDLNPVMVTVTGAIVVDARIRVEPVQPAPDATLRRIG